MLSPCFEHGLEELIPHIILIMKVWVLSENNVVHIRVLTQCAYIRTVHLKAVTNDSVTRYNKISQRGTNEHKYHHLTAFKVAGECLAGVQMSQYFRVDATVRRLDYSTDRFVYHPRYIAVCSRTHQWHDWCQQGVVYSRLIANIQHTPNISHYLQLIILNTILL